jgi:hypothetical protein
MKPKAAVRKGLLSPCEWPRDKVAAIIKEHRQLGIKRALIDGVRIYQFNNFTVFVLA